ncbi:MAG: hypothetical protein KGQ41_09325, partial [Alphaproteobacteria bacterium]|nr:hypothetical protein [Alphaproteobacteria bacterium]
VRGADANVFLQGLLTQDMNVLDTQNVTYGAMLTPQGKIDFDFLIWKQDDGYILECEATRADVLAERLSTFKLRRNVALNVQPIQVVTLWGNEDALKAFSYERDPRHQQIGCRKIFQQPIDKNELSAAIEVESDFYYRLLLQYGIPNGSRDIAIGEDTAADINLEKLNGVSYTKGCYMGQELTSRMHHRGLSKKGLYPVAITGTPLSPFTDIVSPEGNLIGEMRSSNGDMGLAMLRHDSLRAAARMGLVVPELQDDEDAA